MLKIDQQQRVQSQSDSSAGHECCTDRRAARGLRLNQLVLVRNAPPPPAGPMTPLSDGRAATASRSASALGASAPVGAAVYSASGPLARLVRTAPSDGGGAQVTAARRVGPLLRLVRAAALDRAALEGHAEGVPAAGSLSLLWSHSCRSHLAEHRLNESSLRAAEKVLGILYTCTGDKIFFLFVHS